MSSDTTKKKISLCFPIYNKAKYLPELFESYEKIVDLSRCDIVIVDNGSNDGSTKLIREWALKVEARVFRNDFVLPITESWYLALRHANKEFVKLCLGDDPCIADPLEALKWFDESGADYIVGETRTSGVNAAAGDEYFEDVHRFRRKISPVRTVSEKVGTVMDAGLCRNLFGDANSWIFKRSCLEILPDCGKSYNGHLSFPDLELLLRIYLKFNGVYVNQPIGSFEYNNDSPGARAEKESSMNAHFKLMRAAICIEYLCDNSLLEQLNSDDVEKVRKTALARLLDLVAHDFSDQRVVEYCQIVSRNLIQDRTWLQERCHYLKKLICG